MAHKYSELDLMQARIKEVPKGWNFLPIAKAFKIRNELRKPISDDIRSTQQGTYPYYGPTKIQDYIDTYEQDGSYALIGEDGDHFLKYKSQSMTQLVDGKCTVNNHAHIIEGTQLASREWFYYYFMHRDIFSYLSRQGAGRYKLNKASLEKIYLLLPTIEEQNKIVQTLATWDQGISTTEKLLKNSQQQKKALMQQLLTGKKRLLDENGVNFSNEWSAKNLESLVYRPLCYGVLKPGEDILDGHPLIRIQDIDNRGFIDIRKVIRITDELHYEFRRTILNTNDLIISIVGTLGKIFVIPKELNGANITRAFAVIGADPKLIDARFIYQYLNSSMIQEWLLNTATGNAQKVLNIAALKELQIPLPTIEEQRRIAEVLFIADQEIENFQKKLDCLKREKKALMQQLLTGKKRVKVAA